MPESTKELWIIIFLLGSLLFAQAQDTKNARPRGVAKSKAHLYEPTGGHWSCLDGSAKIPYEAINDDYCDCNDGSDEPGTSACLDKLFHCQNKGHIPTYIPNSRVNDGRCEPECCDGSDEFDGQIQCPNTCKQARAEYRKQMKELENLQAEGSRIKREYIEYGKKLKLERQADLEKLEIELVAAKQRVAERKEALDKMEALENLRKESKRDVCRERLTKCRKKIETFRNRIDVLNDQIDMLLGILKDLKNDHNQNYHDMAVKTAIAGYDEFVSSYETEEDKNLSEEDQLDDTLTEDESKPTEIKAPLEVHEPSLWESLIEVPKSSFINILEFFGFTGFQKVTDDPATSGLTKELITARDAHNSAENEVRDAERQIEDVKNKLSNDFGQHDEFAKLDGQCFDHDAGEYTYSLCLFGSATQKSNNDFSSTNLGNFGRWIGADTPENIEYYSKQIYENGMKCWNGPERSLTVTFECGTENKIISVAEPGKCEYIMKMKTPAVCPDQPTADKNTSHDEL